MSADGLTAAAGLPGQAVPVMQAAGAVLWRVASGAPQVLLVHRPRYDDWSWPKGKRDPGESLPACAVREVAEETGLQVVLGRPLPTSRYLLADGATKQVSYWTARMPAGVPQGDEPGHRPPRPEEVDRVLWLDLSSAATRLTRPDDVAQLDALSSWIARGTATTWPLVVVRHGQPYPREEWTLADGDRPLMAAGRRQALALVPLLSAWRPRRVVSSPWLRCRATVEPYAAASGARVRLKGRLSEDGYRRNPDKSARTVARMLERRIPSVLCTHRPVMPTVMGALAERLLPGDPDRPQAAEVLRRAGTDDRESPELLQMGEAVVVHLTTVDGVERVVAAERHLPDSRDLDEP